MRDFLLLVIIFILCPILIPILLIGSILGYFGYILGCYGIGALADRKENKKK